MSVLLVTILAPAGLLLLGFLAIFRWNMRQNQEFDRLLAQYRRSPDAAEAAEAPPLQPGRAWSEPNPPEERHPILVAHDSAPRNSSADEQAELEAQAKAQEERAKAEREAQQSAAAREAEEERQRQQAELERAAQEQAKAKAAAQAAKEEEERAKREAEARQKEREQRWAEDARVHAEQQHRTQQAKVAEEERLRAEQNRLQEESMAAADRALQTASLRAGAVLDSPPEGSQRTSDLSAASVVTPQVIPEEDEEEEAARDSRHIEEERVALQAAKTRAIVDLKEAGSPDGKSRAEAELRAIATAITANDRKARTPLNERRGTVKRKQSVAEAQLISDEDMARRAAKLAEVTAAREARLAKERRKQEAQAKKIKEERGQEVDGILAQIEAIMRKHEPYIQQCRDGVESCETSLEQRLAAEQSAMDAVERCKAAKKKARSDLDGHSATQQQLEDELAAQEAALVAEEAQLLAQERERHGKFEQQKADAALNLRNMMEQQKQRAAKMVKLKVVEARAQKKEAHLRGEMIDGKEFHYITEEAKGVDITQEPWYRPEWARTDCDEYLGSAAKGAFVVRLTKKFHALALQCGPQVDNKIGHVRLHEEEHQGIKWLNVAGTEHFFEDLYDLVLFCHYRPFTFPRMDATNEITLSLTAALQAEEFAQALIAEEQQEAIAKLEAEEAAELSKMKKQLSMKRRNAEEKTRIALQKKRERHESKAKERRIASQKFRRGSETALDQAQRDFAAALEALGRATDNREQAESDLEAARAKLQAAIDARDAEIAQIRALAEQKRKEIEREAEGAKVTITAGKLEINDVVRFGPRNAYIDKKSYEILNLVASAIKENRHIIMVEVAGHCNGGGRDPEGNKAFRMRLSKARAQATMDYLIGKGVPQTRLFCTGYGDSQPIASNDTDAGQAINRRVDFLIHN